MAPWCYGSQCCALHKRSLMPGQAVWPSEVVADAQMAAGAIESAVRIAEGKAKAFAEKAKKPQGLQKGFLSGAPAKADTGAGPFQGFHSCPCQPSSYHTGCTMCLYAFTQAGAAKATKAAEEIQDGLIEDVSDEDGDYDEGWWPVLSCE